MWSSFLSSVLGDSVSAQLAPPVPSYEELHAVAQSVLLPPEYADGVTVHCLQAVNKNFALFHKVGLEPGAIEAGPFGFAPGVGRRSYKLGALVSGAAQWGARWRASGQVDAENGVGGGTLLADVFGDGRLRVHAAAIDAASPKGNSPPEWAVSATARGDEAVGILRAKSGPEFYASLNRRLLPGSAVALGGEVCYAPREKERKMEYAGSISFDAGPHKSSVHLSVTKSRPRGVLSAHHAVHVTDHSTLAAKMMVNVADKTSMGAVGYRMNFRNTGTTLYGMLDTYGNTRQVLERDVMKDFKIGVGFKTRLIPGGHEPTDPVASIRFMVIVGGVPQRDPPLSPLLMSRPIFGNA